MRENRYGFKVWKHVCKNILNFWQISFHIKIDWLDGVYAVSAIFQQFNGYQTINVCLWFKHR